MKGGSDISAVSSHNQALIRIYGHDFSISSLGPISLATPFVISDDACNGQFLSGTLADGSPISAELFNDFHGSAIVLQAVPLPAALPLLGSALLPLGLGFLRPGERRRKTG